MGDAGDDARGDTRWLSYDELAAARGISRASATRLAFRRRWPRTVGNDGTARVSVPLAELIGKPATPDNASVITHDDTRDNRGDVTPVIRALQDTIGLLREQAARERHLADEARAELRAEREAGREREAERAAEREDAADERRRLAERIAALEADRARMSAAAEAEAAQAAAEADDRRPWWRRLLSR